MTKVDREHGGNDSPSLPSVKRKGRKRNKWKKKWRKKKKSKKIKKKSLFDTG